MATLAAACHLLIMEHQRNERIQRNRWNQPRPWWRDIDAECPISLATLSEMQKPPFALQASEQTQHYFDARFLALFLLSTAKFINPLNRQPLTQEDCNSLDQHLQAYFSEEKTHSVSAAYELFQVRRDRREATSREATSRVQKDAIEALKQLFIESSSRQIDVDEFSNIDFSVQFPPLALQAGTGKKSLPRKYRQPNQDSSQHAEGLRGIDKASQIEDRELASLRKVDMNAGSSMQILSMQVPSLQVPSTKLATSSPHRDSCKSDICGEASSAKDCLTQVSEDPCKTIGSFHQGDDCTAVIVSESSHQSDSNVQQNRERRSSQSGCNLRKKQFTTWPTDKARNLLQLLHRGSILKRSDSEFVHGDFPRERVYKDYQLAEESAACVQQSLKLKGATSLYYVQPEPWPEIFGTLTRVEMKQVAEVKDETLEAELDQLKAIYGEDNVTYSMSKDMLGMTCWEIHVSISPLRLHVLIPSRCFYPFASPLLCPRRGDSALSISQTQYLMKKFGSVAATHAGNPFRGDAGQHYLFDLVEVFRSCLGETDCW